MAGAPSRLPWILALVVLAAAGDGAQAQYVRLRVTNDAADDAPVARAQVILLNDRAAWQTDERGVIVVRVQHPGPNIFTVRHLGLEPITTTLNVRENDTLKVHVVMNSAPQLLDTVSVKALSTGSRAFSAFDERRLHSVGGHFITWSDIQRQQPFETVDLFRGVLGIRVVRPPIGDPIIVSTRGLGAAGDRCTPRVGIDGMVLGTSRDFNVNDISPREIYGIEIYDGAASIPGQFLVAEAGGSCGLIMIWTGPGTRQAIPRGSSVSRRIGSRACGLARRSESPD
jgi:TonB-dependent Receptor Plug Domain